ncbi:C-C chemokine receptor type 1-like [Lineus longissimus]|uniref:C-C chemokine receptor type 1-like n=1 Tax=Lineus longissimus TaxID=88925 RepID=UPI00315D72F5
MSAIDNLSANMTINPTKPSILTTTVAEEPVTKNIWPDTNLDEITAIINIYTPPVILAFGTIGNILTIGVLCRKPWRQQSTVFYLLTLAVANTLALFIGCSSEWIAYVSKLRSITILADWLCRVWKFLFNVSVHFPTWLVLAMTIDRFVMVWSPHRAPHICTVFRSKVVIIFITVGLICVSIHAMWTYVLVEHGNAHNCWVGINHHYFHTRVWPWVQGVIYSYIPLSLLFIFILLLSVAMFQRGGEVRILPELNRAVLVISSSYFLFASPATIMNICEYTMPMSQKQLNDVRATVYLTRAVLQVCICLNYAITGLCLFVCCPTFRKDIWECLSCQNCAKNRRGMEEIPTVEINGEGIKIEVEESVVTTPL